MRAKYVGNKADKIILNVQNTEVSANIPKGTPVILKLSDTAQTDDGLDVVLPSTAGSSLSYSLKFGVLTDSLTPGSYGESILFGVANYALVTRMTRAASTDSWTSSASTISGVGLGIDTLNNAFVPGGTVVGSIASNIMVAIMLDSWASSAASASSTADTRTAITNGNRVFVRMM
jgi:hypothetical protein